MLPDNKHDYLTAVQLAAMADVSVSTIWRLKKAGKIPFFQPGGEDCLVRFPPDAFEQRTKLEMTSAEKDENDESTPNSCAKKTHLSGRTPKWMRKVSHINHAGIIVKRSE